MQVAANFILASFDEQCGKLIDPANEPEAGRHDVSVEGPVWEMSPSHRCMRDYTQ
jgi:hypothetical protein